MECQRHEDLEKRLVRMDQKLDTLLEFKWKLSGGWIWLSVIGSVILSLATTALAVGTYFK